MLKHALIIIYLFVFKIAIAQPEPSYWQQQADYILEVDVDVKKFTYEGSEIITYTNNSSDTLRKIFFHLYFNAFQPNSEMDIRSRTIEDPDSRVGNRISKLTSNQIGFLEINSLLVNGKSTKTKLSGTVLEVTLSKPILPKSKAYITLNFEGQIPEQIRRSGRNNKEGVALSMTQWYPKLAEYDSEGWHANPYIGREFHGVFGNYDVKLRLDNSYTIAGTGVLQNPNAIGHGYSKENIVFKKGKKLEWHFKAEKVHDFAWAADPNYAHDVLTFNGDKQMHFFYKNEKKYIEKWKKLEPEALKILHFYEANIGPYPYPQYSIIQGGDGGMEYAMCTLITGDRDYRSLFGVVAHEMAHAWFQHILATNEAKYEWMDEGFTTYISNLAENQILQLKEERPNAGSYDSYFQLAASKVEQPQTTHADRYNYNFSYGVSAYAKGAVFLSQLEYIIGGKALKQSLKSYYKYWKFKHPKPNDFKRIAEKVSCIQLDWYLTDWTMTTNTIDYGIENVEVKAQKTIVNLVRKGNMPMPIELIAEFEDGSKVKYYIPLGIMRGEKPLGKEVQVLDDWAWAFPTYSFEIETPKVKLKSIELNSTKKMADMNNLNDNYKL